MLGYGCPNNSEFLPKFPELLPKICSFKTTKTLQIAGNSPTPTPSPLFFLKPLFMNKKSKAAITDSP
jgi:hypothetical protein